MQATAARFTGPGSGARKYDVLSALALAGLAGDSVPAHRALRLIALITTRYNWAGDSLTIGHDELARLWNVSRRTVIREIDAFRSAGVLQVLRPGRKGRVTSYRLNPEAIHMLAGESLLATPTHLATRLTDRENTPPQVPISQEPQTAIEEIWNKVLDALASKITPAARARWLDQVSVDARGDFLVVGAGSAYRATYIGRAFGDDLTAAARNFGFREVRIHDQSLDEDAGIPGKCRPEIACS